MASPTPWVTSKRRHRGTESSEPSSRPCLALHPHFCHLVPSSLPLRHIWPPRVPQDPERVHLLPHRYTCLAITVVLILDAPPWVSSLVGRARFPDTTLGVWEECPIVPDSSTARHRGCRWDAGQQGQQGRRSDCCWVTLVTGSVCSWGRGHHH